MSNSESLKGKEYVDFLLDFLQGKKDADPKVERKYCIHELNSEEAVKLKEALCSDKDIAYYFNVKDGLKTLVESLKFNTNALDIFQKLLDGDVKLQEDF